MFKHPPILIILVVLFATHFFACSNSEYPEATEWDDIIATWSSEENNQADETTNYSRAASQSSSSEVIKYLPLDDSEYPYAGIPRIVIVTENFREIKDRETEIPAKLQVWSEKAPESEIMDLTIRGRGNSSWNKPQKSYKIEFVEKQSMLGMPKDRDWALIANYTDKTLMKNYLMYHLSAKFGAFYSPKCEFAELFLNKEYLGTYLLTETIKIAKNRINLPQNDSSYIIEVDSKHRENDCIFFSDVLTANGEGKAFKIHAPKIPSTESLRYIQNHIQNFESFLKGINVDKINNIQKWIDVDEFIKYYWLQEFSKNPDTGVNDGFLTSVYFTLIYGEQIKMGPIWDFDLAFGNHTQEKINLSENWHIRKYWYKYLFKDSLFQKKIKEYWYENLTTIESTIDSIETYKNKLTRTANNHYKRWDFTSSTNSQASTTFSPYEENVENLKKWIQKRIQWINNQEL